MYTFIGGRIFFNLIIKRSKQVWTFTSFSKPTKSCTFVHSIFDKKKKYTYFWTRNSNILTPSDSLELSEGGIAGDWPDLFSKCRTEHNIVCI